MALPIVPEFGPTLPELVPQPPVEPWTLDEILLRAPLDELLLQLYAFAIFAGDIPATRRIVTRRTNVPIKKYRMLNMS